MDNLDKLSNAERNQIKRLAQMVLLLHSTIYMGSGNRETATAAVKGAMPELTRKAFTGYDD